jgi:hypothetical protein
MGGMISDLIARGERKRDNPWLKSDYGRNKCQELQLIRVFGTDTIYVLDTDMGNGDNTIRDKNMGV